KLLVYFCVVNQLRANKREVLELPHEAASQFNELVASTGESLRGTVAVMTRNGHKRGPVEFELMTHARHFADLKNMMPAFDVEQHMLQLWQNNEKFVVPA